MAAMVARHAGMEARKRDKISFPFKYWLSRVVEGARAEVVAPVTLMSAFD